MLIFVNIDLSRRSEEVMIIKAINMFSCVIIIYFQNIFKKVKNGEIKFILLIHFTKRVFLKREYS